MAHAVILTGVLVVALGLNLAAERKGFPGRVLFKMTASTAFLAIAYRGGALETPYGRGVFAALLLWWLGDLLLAYTDKTLFLIGLFAFLGAHGVLMYAFARVGFAPLWAAVALAGTLLPAAFIVPWLRPHVPNEMKIPVYAYMAIISAMVALAAAAVGAGGPPILIFGAGLFYVSDIFVARQRFVKPGYANAIIGLPQYYAAVWCLAISVWLAPNG